MATEIKFVVVDGRNGNAVVGKPYASRSRAQARADKLDQAYGAYRYFVKEA